MSKARKFSFSARPKPRRTQANTPKQGSAQSRLPSEVNVPEGPPPALRYPGSTRYARIFDAMRALEKDGFGDDTITGEMVSLSGYFAHVQPLTKNVNGPCDVHIRKAFHPRA